MVDAFLIITMVVGFLLLSIASVYFLVHYSHPDDKNDAYLPKLTVVLGFVLAGATVLLLPLDVANNEGYAGCDGYDTAVCGGLNMLLFWNIIYYLVPIFLFLLLPFMTFFYEADDGMVMAGTSVGASPNSRICEAIKYETGVLVIFGIVLGVCFWKLAESEVPVEEYRGVVTPIEVVMTGNGGGNFTKSMLGTMSVSDVDYMTNVGTTANEITIPIDLSLSTFFAAILSFAGWFFFAVFGGVGLAAMPLDLVLAFVRRPKHMDAVEFAEAQVNIRQRVNELVDVGELIKIQKEDREKIAEGNGNGGGGWGNPFKALSKEAREERNTYLEFKKAVYLLEKDVEDFQACSSNYKSYNPLKPWISLFLGVFAVILSLVWLIQIGINVLPNEPLHPFLNGFLRWFEGWFPPFGVIVVAILSMYLLACALLGCFKFGLRFVFFQLHPMEIGKTYMSSFLFNVGLVLLCALPVVQFTTDAFEDYARYTTVGQVFGIQIRYMKFFGWFWRHNVFVYALAGVAALTAVYLCFCKKVDENKSSIQLRDRLRGGS